MVLTYFPEKSTRCDVDFTGLHCRLLSFLRSRVRSGELTERGLARITHVSQPHIHNVLNGRRFFSMSMADQVLRSLRIGLLDLLTAEDFARHAGEAPPAMPGAAVSGILVGCEPVGSVPAGAPARTGRQSVSTASPPVSRRWPGRTIRS